MNEMSLIFRESEMAYMHGWLAIYYQSITMDIMGLHGNHDKGIFRFETLSSLKGCGFLTSGREAFIISFCNKIIFGYYIYMDSGRTYNNIKN